MPHIYLYTTDINCGTYCCK